MFFRNGLAQRAGAGNGFLMPRLLGRGRRRRGSDLAPVLAVAIAERLEPLERQAAKERASRGKKAGAEIRNIGESSVEILPRAKSLDRVVSAVGMSRPTVKGLTLFIPLWFSKVPFSSAKDLCYRFVYQLGAGPESSIRLIDPIVSELGKASNSRGGPPEESLCFGVAFPFIKPLPLLITK